MKYIEFVEKIRLLLKEAYTLFDKEEIHNDPEFRKWRLKLTTAIDAIEKENYKINCNVKYRTFDLRGVDVFRKDKIRRYNQELQDTINELETILEYYDEFGEPNENANNHSGPNTGSVLAYPNKVTLAWLYEHAPFGLWLKLGGILFAAFVLGITFSQTVAYTYIQILWK